MPSLIETLNKASKQSVSDLLKGVVERSPWVIDELHTMRPFADMPALLAAVEGCINALSEAHRTKLVRAHSELADCDAADAEMSNESLNEQGRLGLFALSPDEQEQLAYLNREYRNRFGFPFIIALEAHPDLASVFREFEKRLKSERAEEMDMAISQINIVVRSRIKQVALAYEG